MLLSLHPLNFLCSGQRMHKIEQSHENLSSPWWPSPPDRAMAVCAWLHVQCSGEGSTPRRAWQWGSGRQLGLHNFYHLQIIFVEGMSSSSVAIDNRQSPVIRSCLILFVVTAKNNFQRWQTAQPRLISVL